MKRRSYIFLTPQGENTCGRVFYLIKLQASGLQLYEKGDSNTGVFLWIFQNL